MKNIYEMSIEELNNITNSFIENGYKFIWNSSSGEMPNFAEAININGFAIKTMTIMNKYKGEKVTLTLRGKELFSSYIDSFEKCEYMYRSLLKNRFSKLEVK